MGQVGSLNERHWAGLMHVPVTVRSVSALNQLQADLQDSWQITRGDRTMPLFLLAPASQAHAQ